MPSGFKRRQVLQYGAGLGVGALLAGTYSPRALAVTLDEIKKKGKVTVAVEAAYEPFEFVKDGKIVGYGQDILAYIVKDMGVQPEVLDLPWQGILPGVLARKFDFVATAVTLTEERSKKYAFTMPIAEGTPGLIKRKGDDRIKTIDDLKGMVVGVQLSSAAEQALRSFDEKLKAKGGGLKEIKTYTGNPEGYLDLANQKLDAYANTFPNLKVLEAKQPDTYEFVDKISDTRWIGWVTHPEDKALRDYLTSKIAELKSSGKLTELQKQWFGFVMEVPSSGYLPAGAV